jgi:hypothetical protein
MEQWLPADSQQPVGSGLESRRWFVGTRDGGAACHFVHDLHAGRLAHRVQLTTDGLGAYIWTVLTMH